MPYIDRLTFSQRITHDVDGNWKILVDNYLECYHCVPNHPSFVDLMAVKQYDIKTFSNFSIHTAPAGRPDNLAYHIDPTLYNHPRFDGWYLWPNLTLNMFPGTENLLIFHTIPVSADRCIGYCDYFFPDDTVNEQAKQLIEWETSVLSKEDNERISLTHKGLKSGALEAGFFLNRPGQGRITEHALKHFHKLLDDATKPLSEI